MKANLQDAQQMKMFMEEFEHEYTRNGQGVDEDQEHSSGVRHLQEAGE